MLKDFSAADMLIVRAPHAPALRKAMRWRFCRWNENGGPRGPPFS